MRPVADRQRPTPTIHGYNEVDVFANEVIHELDQLTQVAPDVDFASGLEEAITVIKQKLGRNS